MSLETEQERKAAATAALDYIKGHTIIGIGTGNTANFFIEALANIKHKIEGAVASSVATEKQLKATGIDVIDFNSIAQLPLYVDGADEVSPLLQLIKGGGGALTREKILATAAKQFVCIVDHRKKVQRLGAFPVAVEVIPMARSFVAREIVKLGGNPVYRQGALTDNGNILLDVYDLTINEPIKLEQALNNIPGVVANGLFALRPADVVLVGTGSNVECLQL